MTKYSNSAKSFQRSFLKLIPPDFFLLQDPEESARNSPFSCETEFQEKQEALEYAYPEHWQVGQQLSERIEGSVSFLREIDSFLKDHGAERTPGKQSGKSIINLSDISMGDLQPLGRSGDFETMPRGDLQHEKAHTMHCRGTQNQWANDDVKEITKKQMEQPGELSNFCVNSLCTQKRRNSSAMYVDSARGA
ncbi:uncharacterized protein LOC129788337 [Lutzomyia longipalpis]|uniref:uncharacterized protein LOC129788337 n=1 Tax=Lutzomyia longipalpis TaxID=7200 RepID=UPI002483AADB|nr:uncharacterized protein LOC129788337 [Lutzomyia longipalpis]